MPGILNRWLDLATKRPLSGKRSRRCRAFRSTRCTAMRRSPGEYPYTRGIPRVDVPLAAVDDAHVRRLRHGRGHQRPLQGAVALGGTGLSTAFDMPTLMGRDSDDAWAVGEVGKAGVAVDTLADMDDLFRDIDLGHGHDVDDHQRAGVDRHGDVHRGRRAARHSAGGSSVARSRTTSSRSTRRRRSTSSRRARRCGSSPT